MATAAVTQKHVLVAMAIVTQKTPDFQKPAPGFDAEVVKGLIPASITNPVQALAVGFFAYLLLCGSWLNRAGFVWLETTFPQHGNEAGFYVADLQYYHSRSQQEANTNGAADLLSLNILEP